MLQTPYQLHGPPLELLQQLHVLLLLGSPERCTVLQVGSHSILSTQKHSLHFQIGPRTQGVSAGFTQQGLSRPLNNPGV